MNFVLLFFILPVILADDKNAAEIVKANNLFASDVYKEITKTAKGNIVASPFSVDTVLALLQSGCKGSTAQQIRTALHLPNNEEKIESGFKSLLLKLASNKSYIFDTANKMYLQKNFVVRKSFVDVATEDFDAASENVDFSKSSEAAATINQWVANKTNNTIKDLISPNALSAATVLVLVNAIHFKANWSFPFSISDTRKSPFYKTATDVSQVDTLRLSGKYFNYYECDCLKAQFLELPFQGRNASMIFVLPKGDLATLEKQVDKVFRLDVKYESTFLNVELPKFKIENSFDLIEPLQALNVTNIFNPKDADLSGISRKKGDLVVSKVAQKAVIDLNEGGVEAAAATYVGVVSLSSPINAPIPKDFKADHPFLYLIRINNLIIFCGRVTDPKY